MNRKNSKIFIALAVGMVLLITTSVMSFANAPSGYESFKEILKSQKNEVKNATVNLDVKVSDNSKEVLAIKSTIKGDESSQTASGTVDLTVDGIEKTFDFYGTKGEGIVKIDDKYLKFVANEDKELKKHGFNKDRRNKDHEMTATEEAIMDAIVGDFKNNFSEKNLENGSKEVSFSVEEGDIPDIVNLLLEAKHDEKDNKAEMEFGKCKELENIFGITKEDVKLTELKSDIKIKSVTAKVVVDKNNQITGFGLVAEVSGKDENSEAHTMKVEINAEFSDIDSTKVDVIDLKGKEVTVITEKFFEDCEK